MIRLAVWKEIETESVIGYAFDGEGNPIRWLRSTSESLLVYMADSLLGRPIEFVWIGYHSRALVDQPWLVFARLSEEVAA